MNLDIGQLVEIKILGLQGYVTAIKIIKGPQYNYEVSYFTNGEYCQHWFEDFEIKEVL